VGYLRKIFRIVNSDRSPRTLLVLATATVLAALAYLPALGGYAAFDDFAQLAPVYDTLARVTPASLWEALWSSQAGPSGRPLAMATYVIQIAFLKADIVQLKYVNLLIHLLTGWLLYRLAAVILGGTVNNGGDSKHGRSGFTAAAIAAVWLLHPFNLTSVAYLVQRMNSLSALFVVAALLAYSRMRMRPVTLRTAIRPMLAVSLLWMCAILSKENALLLPVYILALEFTVLRDRPFIRSGAVTARTLRHGLLTAVIAVAATYLVWNWPSLTGEYRPRTFTMEQRLLTEARVLVWYLFMLVAPNIRQMGLYHDDWLLSTSLLSPVTTLPAVLLLGCAAVLAVALRRRYPVMALGLLWWLGGHLLESTVFPLELVFEHRNYLPGFGPLLILGWLISRFLPAKPGLLRAPLLVCMLALGLLLAWSTHLRAQRWSIDPRLRLVHLEERSASLRARIEAAQTYGELATLARTPEQQGELIGRAEELFSAASRDFPERPEPLFGWLLLRYYHGRTDTAEIVTELRHRIASALPDATVQNGLRAVTRCVIKGPCRPLAAEAPALLDSALQNPRLGQSGKSRLFRELAWYRFHIDGDSGSALDLMNEAASLAPRDINAILDEVRLALLAGDRSIAADRLQRAARIDRLGKKTYTLQNLWVAISVSGKQSALTDK